MPATLSIAARLTDQLSAPLRTAQSGMEARMFQPTPGFSTGRSFTTTESGWYPAPVSTHAQLFSRAKPASRDRLAARSAFQPTPGFSAGRSPQYASSPEALAIRFNPRPAFQPGEAVVRLIRSCVEQVSTHARLFSRAKHRRARGCCWRLARFNPRPAFQPGEAAARGRLAIVLASFNPRPAFQPGEAA